MEIVMAANGDNDGSREDCEQQHSDTTVQAVNTGTSKDNCGKELRRKQWTNQNVEVKDHGRKAAARNVATLQRLQQGPAGIVEGQDPRRPRAQKDAGK